MCPPIHKYYIYFFGYAISLPFIHFFIHFFNKCVDYVEVRASTVARVWPIKMNKLCFLLSGLNVITQLVAVTIMKKTERNYHLS